MKSVSAWLFARCSTILCDAAGLDGRDVLLWSGVATVWSIGGDMEWEGFRRKLIFVLLLLDKDIEGEVGGGIALLRDRFGEG